MRFTSALFAGALVAASACSPPPELENVTLNESFSRLFQDFDNNVEALPGLIEAMEREVDAEGVAWSGDFSQRSFTITDKLTPEEMGGATWPEGQSPDDQIAVVVFGESRHGFDKNVEVAMESNQVCIESDSTINYYRTYEGDPNCIKDGTCDSIDSEAVVHKWLGLGAIRLAAGWYEVQQTHRRFDLEDGRKVLITRSWFDKAYTGYGGGSFNQSFTVQGWLDDGNGVVRRFYVIWTDLRLDAFSGGALLDLISESLDEGFTRGDNFADNPGDTSGYCGEDRNRENTRSQDEG